MIIVANPFAIRFIVAGPNRAWADPISSCAICSVPQGSTNDRVNNDPETGSSFSRATPYRVCPYRSLLVSAATVYRSP